MTANNVSNLRPVPRPKIQNMVAVASGKGGVGKTWFAITLAHTLAICGRLPFGKGFFER